MVDSSATQVDKVNKSEIQKKNWFNMLVINDNIKKGLTKWPRSGLLPAGWTACC